MPAKNPKVITIDGSGNAALTKVSKSKDGAIIWQANPPQEWWIRFNGSPFVNEITTAAGNGKSPALLLAPDVQNGQILYTISSPAQGAKRSRVMSAAGILIDS